MTLQDLNEPNLTLNPYENDRYEIGDNICKSFFNGRPSKHRKTSNRPDRLRQQERDDNM